MLTKQVIAKVRAAIHAPKGVSGVSVVVEKVEGHDRVVVRWQAGGKDHSANYSANRDADDLGAEVAPLVEVAMAMTVPPAP